MTSSAPTLSPTLGRVITEAMDLACQMRANGVPDAEIVAGIERTVRQSWPFTREWKFLCNHCDDLGAIWHTCPGDGTCGRSGKVHGPHRYVEPCWCDLGRRFREKRKNAESAVEDAARTRPMTRVGR